MSDPCDSAPAGAAPGILADLLLTHSPVGVALVDEQLRYVFVNPALAGINGLPAAAHLGRTVTEVLGERAAGIEERIRRVISSGAAVTDVELSGTNRAGRPVTLLASWYPVTGGDGFRGVGAIVHDITERTRVEARRRRTEQRYRTLVESTAQLVWSTRADGLVAEDSPSWRAFTGQTYEQWVGEGWLDALHPDDVERARQAWARAVASQGRYEIEYRVRAADGSYRRMLTRGAPIMEDGRVLEWLGANFDVTEQRGAEEERDRLAAAVRAEGERHRRLHELGSRLALGVTLETVTREAAAGLAAAVGATGAALLLRDARGVQRPVAEYAMPVWPWSTRRVLPADVPTPACIASATGQPVRLASAAELAAAFPAATAGGTLPDGAVEAYPLRHEGAVIGAAVLWFAGGRPPEAGLDLAGLCAEACDLVAQAVTRARLFEREHSIAAGLQRSMLPRELPAVPGADVAAVYLPGSSEADVGGDWYEVLALADGRLLLAVGDVMGRGLPAAFSMSELRQALRAYAVVCDRPAQLVETLSRYQSSVAGDRDQLVTLLVAVFDPDQGRLTWTSAGHLPLALRAGAGGTRLLEQPPGLPVGVGCSWPEATVALHPGDLVLLVSDGLVEQRRVSLDDGLARLVTALDAAPRDSAAGCCDQLVADLVGERPREDDVTVLALRVPEPGWAPAWRLPPHESSVPQARRLAAVRLQQLSVRDPGVLDVAALLVSELVTNAVHHGRGEVELRVTRTHDTARISVTDAGPAVGVGPRENDLDSLAGRGLLLVEALAADWGVEDRPVGKTVWLELDLPASPSANAPRDVGRTV